MKSIKISHFIQYQTRDPEKGIELSQGIKRLFLKTTGQINRIDATSDCQSMIPRTVPCLYQE
ncbi:MAG: hypothetical protein KBI07_00050 [Candidatus Atribacteria bacterium]|nr:hypothetical protein [Candidatus Atribacteria bacterium]